MVAYPCNFSIRAAEAGVCVCICCLSAYPHMQATMYVEIRGQFAGVMPPHSHPMWILRVGLMSLGPAAVTFNPMSHLTGPWPVLLPRQEWMKVVSYLLLPLSLPFLPPCTPNVLNLVLSLFDVCSDGYKLDSEVLQINGQVLKGFGGLAT